MFSLEKTTFGLGLYICLIQIGGSDKEFIHIYLSQGVVFPSATYVRNLISKEVIKQVIEKDSNLVYLNAVLRIGIRDPGLGAF